MISENGFFFSGDFSPSDFEKPPLPCAPVYTWTWDAPLSDDETDRQLEEMQSLGIRRFYVLPLPSEFRPKSHPTLLSPSYLSDGYMAAYRHALLKAKELGMQVWLYDEGGWPSGGACGKVTEEDPSLQREILKERKVVLKKKRSYKPGKGVVAAFSKGRRIEKGASFPEKRQILEYYQERVSSGGDSANVPDLTKKEATDAFIRITHEKYEEAIGDLFGNLVTACFTDEPTAPRPFAYREALAEEFLRLSGEDIRDHLPALFKKGDLTEEEKEIRIRYFSFLADTFAENYLEKEKAWCEERGLAFLGHMDKDDEPNGSFSGGSFDLLLSLGALDCPGVDAIWRQIFPPVKGVKRSECGFFPRLASSAAAANGGRHALTESFAVYGNGLTPEEMRYVLSYQAMRGINVFNLMMFSYGRTGFLRSGELPHFAKTHGAFRDLAAFNLFAERLSYLFSLGERVAPVALYFPIRDSLCGDLKENEYLAAGNKLERRRVSFDLISDRAIENARIEKGALSLGRAAYECVLIPPCRHMSKEAKEKLASFARKGGKILCLDEANAKEIEGAEFVKDLSFFRPDREVEGEHISFCESKLERAELLFLMNEGAARETCAISLPERKTYLLDLSQGKIVKPSFSDGKLNLSLESGEIAAILLSDDPLPFELPFEPTGEISVGEWNFRALDRFVIAKDSFETRALQDAPRPLSLGDWRKRVGKAFTGSGEYSASFSLDRIPERAVIDLGTVRYSAEVFLNGASVGTLWAPPYRIELPAERFQNQNEIKVRVTNSAANEFEYTRAFRRYKKYQLTRYIDVEKEFQKSSLSGGLFGDVKIFLQNKK